MKKQKKEKYGFVYIWFDKKHKRYYIGCHWGHEHDGYICSSNWMRDAYRRRPDDFKRRILSNKISNRQDLYLKEGEWLSLIKPEEIKVRYYNICLGNTTHWTAKDNSLSIGEKISKANKGKRFSPKTEIKPGQRMSPDTEFKKGVKPHNAGFSYVDYYGEEKANELRKKQSLVKRGQRMSPDTEFKKGEVSHNARPVLTPFGEFRSLRDASINLEISVKRILTKIKKLDSWSFI